MDTPNRMHEGMAKMAAIDAIAANFGGQAMPENLKRLWLELLEPYTAAQVARAAKNVIEQYEYKTLPPYAVLKRAIDAVTGVSEESIEFQAVAEWGKLLEAIRVAGPYRTPRLHSTTAAVVRLLGGWGAVCGWLESEMQYRRKEFIDFWTQTHGREDALALGAEAARQAISMPRHQGVEAMSVGQGVFQLMSGLRREDDEGAIRQ